MIASHDLEAAILVSRNDEALAMLMSQTTFFLINICSLISRNLHDHANMLASVMFVVQLCTSNCFHRVNMPLSKGL